MAGEEPEKEVDQGGEEGEQASCEAVFFAERTFVIERLKVLAGPAATFNEAAADAALETITKYVQRLMIGPHRCCQLMQHLSVTGVRADNNDPGPSRSTASR